MAFHKSNSEEGKSRSSAIHSRMSVQAEVPQATIAGPSTSKYQYLFPWYFPLRHMLGFSYHLRSRVHQGHPAGECVADHGGRILRLDLRASRISTILMYCSSARTTDLLFNASCCIDNRQSRAWWLYSAMLCYLFECRR